MNPTELPKSPSDMKKALIDLLCKKSVKVSETDSFTLASGKKSNFYINCKPTALDPQGMFFIGHLIMEELENSSVHAIGGLTFGADPVAMATAFASGLKGKPLQAFSIRKEQKDHGLIRWVEGDVNPGDRVVIIDDVATTGGSTIKAINRAMETGLDVCKVIVLVDREEGGMDNIRQHISDASAILTRSELMEHFLK
ncbi:orotate phosphoribosyltransferase [Desulfobotulus alkaliphilus]|uniref:Orotate phosphoribosyltransferase n=1 Tax=Desulfobotulus alkaliphilus TaxID=622671 RepID=A0A562S303_9BACT|nr:orotate phosphoribosyltransferase [Desulfobotulus alkaliphilus]TWI75548.1 orotate phosphoribosyltransferase [Desulfobotulus alkaliphilus]